MNGIKSNEVILPKDAEAREKKINAIKLLLCLILTNTLTFFLVFPSNDLPTAPQSEKARSGHVFVELNIKNHVSFTSGKVAEESTLFFNNKVVLSHVWLHANFERRDKVSAGIDNSERFLVEVPLSSLNELVTYKDKILSAYPWSNYRQQLVKGDVHEILF